MIDFSPASAPTSDALTHSAGPPRFVLERHADGALLAVWSNPPPSVDALDALELREIAVALLDMARVIDAERGPGADGHSASDATGKPGSARESARRRMSRMH